MSRGIGFISDRAARVLLARKTAMDMPAAQAIDTDVEHARICYFGGGKQLIETTDHVSPANAAITISFREIVGTALRHGAVGVSLSHSHPSGCALPSKADIDVTRKLVRLLRMLDIDVYDHVIMAQNARFSFRDAGLM